MYLPISFKNVFRLGCALLVVAGMCFVSIIFASIKANKSEVALRATLEKARTFYDVSEVRRQLQLVITYLEQKDLTHGYTKLLSSSREHNIGRFYKKLVALYNELRDMAQKDYDYYLSNKDDDEGIEAIHMPDDLWSVKLSLPHFLLTILMMVCAGIGIPLVCEFWDA